MLPVLRRRLSPHDNTAYTIFSIQLLHNLTTLYLIGKITCANFMDVTMGDIPGMVLTLCGALRAAMLNPITTEDPVTQANAAQTEWNVSDCNYSQTSLIRASITRMPHNPNTVPGNFYHVLFTMFSNPHFSQSEHILTVPSCSDKRCLHD